MLSSRRRSLPLFAKAITALHRALYRWTGGRIGGRFGRMPMLLLTSEGRKSGMPRTTPLTYLPDGDDYVLIASNGGQDWSPAWVGNLQAHPATTVQIGPRTLPVIAALATAEQRARLWPIVVERYPNYLNYARKTNREIPLVILHPV
jgi:deazaflavin-dependent oxidoreductase (nitroreductase family)